MFFIHSLNRDLQGAYWSHIAGCWASLREATEDGGGGGGAAVTKLKLAGCRNNETEESSRVILTHRAGVFNNTETPRSGGMRCWREEKQPDADTS